MAVVAMLEAHVVHDLVLTLDVLRVAALRADGSPTLGAKANARLTLCATMRAEATAYWLRHNRHLRGVPTSDGAVAANP